MTNALLLMTVCGLLAAGQLLFKAAGLAIRGKSAGEMAWVLATLPAFHASLVLYGVATLLWVFVLSRVSLSQAYPWMAAATVLVPLLAWLAYGERVGGLYWVGMALILAGLAVTQMASASS
jgi:drug/metabolite transporter (DMT)-like permease